MCVWLLGADWGLGACTAAGGEAGRRHQLTSHLLCPPRPHPSSSIAWAPHCCATDMLVPAARRYKYTWVEQYSEELRKSYFYNQETGASTWERPPDMSWRRIKVSEE
jgi:hypothetical protein